MTMLFPVKKMLLSMNKGAIKETKKLLTASEQVFFSAPLNISVKPVVRKLNDKLTIKGKVNGILTITNKRVLFVESNLGIGTTKQILISDITSIDSKKSFITFPVRICGITDMFVIDCTKDENERILNALNRAR